MATFPHWLCHLKQLAGMLLTLLVDVFRYIGLCLCSPAVLAAENLFLRKQLALYRERHITPRRVTPATCIALVWLGDRAATDLDPLASARVPALLALAIQSWTSTITSGPAHAHLPAGLRTLIRRMARENPTWGEERIANELWLKLGLRVSPRTVRKYLPKPLDHGRGKRVSSQHWRTFVRNHAQAIVACDFCVVVTATFRRLSVLVVMEHATRRILHANVTAHPTAPWTLQQLREAIPAEHAYRFLIHDRDAIFSQELDRHVGHLGLKVLKTPPQSPQANALCERLVGTIRRECLDFMIPLTEHHLRRILREWVSHYNTGRAHMALGPGIPQPPPSVPVPPQAHRHRLPAHLHVVARPILGGLHHEYSLEKKAA